MIIDESKCDKRWILRAKSSFPPHFFNGSGGRSLVSERIWKNCWSIRSLKISVTMSTLISQEDIQQLQDEVKSLERFDCSLFLWWEDGLWIHLQTAFTIYILGALYSIALRSKVFESCNTFILIKRSSPYKNFELNIFDTVMALWMSWKYFCRREQTLMSRTRCVFSTWRCF
jgi:hypothetical protein